MVSHSETNLGGGLSLKRILSQVVLASLLSAGGTALLGGTIASASPNHASSESFLVATKKTVAGIEAPQTTWNGPQSGPVAAKGKTIVYLSGQESNSLDAAYGNYLKAMAKRIGWKVTVIDGQGTPTGWTDGMNQAVALHPDGIIIFADATSLAKPIAAAHAAHIPVIGLHASAYNAPGDGLYTNIQENAPAIGRAEADIAIADSNGTARVIIVTHNEYAIARIKSDAMKAELAKCHGCKLLTYVNYPAAESSSRTAQLVTSWVSAYGPNFYALTVGDNDWDFAVPALKAGGVPPTGGVKLIGSDGIASAYRRIREGQYQVATIPEPAQEEADYALYQMNRAFHGLAPTAWYPPIYAVVKSNVNAEGGAQDNFDPDNRYQARFTSLLTTGHS